MLKNNCCTSVLSLFFCISVLLLLSAGSVMAMEQYPYFDPQKGCEAVV